MLYLCLISILILVIFWIGYVSRDRHIRRQLQLSAEERLQNSLFMSGDAINHLKCLSILDNEDIVSILDNLPDDRYTDGSYIPIPIRRLFHSVLSNILRYRKILKSE